MRITGKNMVFHGFSWFLMRLKTSQNRATRDAVASTLPAMACSVVRPSRQEHIGQRARGFQREPRYITHRLKA